jgi:hypothetical protein
MTLDKIQQLVGSLAKSLDDNERIATPVLAAKLAKCMAAYPGDQTIGSMARVIDKMADNNTLFIRKADFKSLYSKLYSNNTKFGQLFQDELGIVEPASPVTVMVRDEATNLNPYEVADPVLANALPSLFDKQLPVKMYSKTLAAKAVSSVGSSLDSWGLKPNNLSVGEGNDKFLVIKADYETPKGMTSFYVPVELHKDNVVEATVFMGNTGPQDLNHQAIKSYVTSQAGNKLKVNAATILGALTTAASENRVLSDTELAMTRLSATRQGKSEFFADGIVGQKVSEASQKDVQLPKFGEFESFEKQFTSPQGLAAWKFGADKVKTAAAHITREVLGMGYKGPQVTVTGNDESTIFYGVSLDNGKVAFTVPVKLTNNKLQKPGLLMCNGTAAAFDKEGINSLYINNQSDFKTAAAASPLFGLKPSDLIDSIRQAAAEGNYGKAEDALNVLASCNDSKAYATGFALYKSGLLGQVAPAATQCSKMIKSASSEHPICSHTGLPVHKVYQDKDGNCRPLYRRGMEETYEGASFMNSKIFG